MSADSKPTDDAALIARLEKVRDDMMMACDCDGRGCTLCNGADVVRDARTALRELQGTPEWRFHLLLQQLAQRFPDTAAVSAEPYELRFLSWLDDLKSRA